jgi:hypothetical protein
MIVLLVFRSIAFGALFAAPLDWQTKVFLASALLLVDFHFSLLDAQADHNNNAQYLLFVTALKALERKVVDSEAPSVQSALEEMGRLQAAKEAVFSIWTSTLLVFSGGIAISIFIGWLLSRFVFSAVL